MRWAQDGIALILPNSFGSTNPPQILLLRGPFVLPAEATSNAAPALSAVGTGTLAAGGGNQYLAITGTGFLPAASILWNGVVHDTTYIDAQHLSLGVGAPDVKSAGPVTLTCRNPGSVNSNMLTLTVQ